MPRLLPFFASSFLSSRYFSLTAFSITCLQLCFFRGAGVNFKSTRLSGLGYVVPPIAQARDWRGQRDLSLGWPIRFPLKQKPLLFCTTSQRNNALLLFYITPNFMTLICCNNAVAPTFFWALYYVTMSKTCCHLANGSATITYSCGLEMTRQKHMTGCWRRLVVS